MYKHKYMYIHFYFLPSSPPPFPPPFSSSSLPTLHHSSLPSSPFPPPPFPLSLPHPFPSPFCPLPPHSLQPLQMEVLPIEDTTASHRNLTKACPDRTALVVKGHCTNQTPSLCHLRPLATANVHHQPQAAVAEKTHVACLCPALTHLCSCVFVHLFRTPFVSRL